MKFYLVIVVSLALIAQSQCGLIDGIIGTVTNTTSSIKEGIGGALHYGKTFVFGGSEPTETGRTIIKPGLIGTVSMKIHDVAHVMRAEVIQVFSMFDKNQTSDGTEGIVARLLNKVKNRIVKVKSFLFGNGLAQIENDKNSPIKLSNDTSLLSGKLKKYFSKYNLSNSDSGFKKTMLSLQDVVNKIRQNITSHKNKPGTDGADEEDGAGLIDIRTSAMGMGESIKDDFVNGIDTGYDKIEDGINEGRGKAKDSMDAMKKSSSNFIVNQRNSLQNNFEKLGNRGNNLRNNVYNSIDNAGNHLKDETNKVKDAMENAYKEVKFESK